MKWGSASFSVFTSSSLLSTVCCQIAMGPKWHTSKSSPPGHYHSLLISSMCVILSLIQVSPSPSLAGQAAARSDPLRCVLIQRATVLGGRPQKSQIILAPRVPDHGTLGHPCPLAGALQAAPWLSLSAPCHLFWFSSLLQ
jgi:hypothetical protein